jgi:hypothetical protein
MNWLLIVIIIIAICVVFDANDESFASCSCTQQLTNIGREGIGANCDDYPPGQKFTRGKCFKEFDSKYSPNNSYIDYDVQNDEVVFNMDNCKHNFEGSPQDGINFCDNLNDGISKCNSAYKCLKDNHPDIVDISL